MKRIVCAVVALTLSACETLPPDAITIENRTDHVLQVVWRGDGSEGTIFNDLQPRVTTHIRLDCIVNTIVALGADNGTEIDRIEGPVCRGDDPIVIDGLP